MKTKHIISIVQIGDNIKTIYINNEDTANEYASKYSFDTDKGIRVKPKMSHHNVYAELKDKDTNIVSIILKLGEVESVYLNNAEKCESDYSMLAKDSDKEYGTYKLIHTNQIEGEM